MVPDRQIHPIDPAGEAGPDLLALQHASYACEAEVIGDSRIPPLTEDLDGLCAAGLQWLGWFDGDRLLGAIAWSRTDDELDIERLVVDPIAHRRGIGRALLSALLATQPAPRVVVATGRENHPARNLYRTAEFRHIGDAEVIDGLWISRYERVTPADLVRS